mmetsp:Transcript_30205/g.86214  ORF Transcript_30205/g.86214 Transcript_30205/m.86214 type:complete len:337 (+) Transcript_30205:278-1288(+)
MFVVHRLFRVLLLEESLLGKGFGLLYAVRHNNVVKQGTRLNLPNFETNMCASILANLVHALVVLVVGVWDHWVDPLALVIGVVDHFLLPWSLVFWVVNHRRFPFTIVLVIPVLGFGGIRVGDFRRNIVPAFWLFVLGVRHFGLIHPVGGLGGVGVLDFLFGQEVEVLIQSSLSHRLVVNENLERVVGVQDESVQMRQVVCFRGNFLLDEQIIVLLVGVENDVGLFVRSTAHIWSKHHRVGCVATKAGRVELVSTREQFDVGASTVQVLLVLDGILDDKGLVAASEGFIHLGRQSVESGVLGSLDSLVLRVTVPLSSGVLPLSHFTRGLPFRRFRPP